MIPEGRFKAQLAMIERILKKVALLDEKQASPNKSLGAAHFRGMTYRQVYEECIREFAYDFKLSDLSLLLFIKGGRDIHDGELNFCYYECPVRVMPYPEFVASQLSISPEDPSLTEELAAWGDELRNDYEEYVTSEDVKAVVTPLRFDYKPTQYRAGIHPASHLHFGFENEIRVATRRIMNPISFLLFLLRQRYPEKWQQFLETPTSNQLCRNIRQEIAEVDGEYWCDEDERDLSLH